MKYFFVVCLFSIGGLTTFATEISTRQIQHYVYGQLVNQQIEPVNIEKLKQQIQAYSGENGEFDLSSLVKYITGVPASHVHSLWYQNGTFLIVSLQKDIDGDRISAQWIKDKTIVKNSGLHLTNDNGQKFLSQYTDGMTLLIDRKYYNELRNKRQREILKNFTDFAKSKQNLPDDAYLALLRTYIVDTLNWPAMGNQPGIVFIGIANNELVLICEMRDENISDVWEYHVLHQEVIPEFYLKNYVIKNTLLTTRDLRGSSSPNSSAKEGPYPTTKITNINELFELLTAKKDVFKLAEISPLYMGKTYLEEGN